MCENTIPEYTPGGRAKDFLYSVTIRLRRGDWISEGTGTNKEIVGQEVKFMIDKNKTYKRKQTGEFDFYFSENSVGVKPGFNDNEKEAVMCAVEWGIITRSGSWFMYNNNKYQGIPALVSALKEDPALMQNIEKEVLDRATQRVN